MAGTTNTSRNNNNPFGSASASSSQSSTELYKNPYAPSIVPSVQQPQRQSDAYQSSINPFDSPSHSGRAGSESRNPFDSPSSMMAASVRHTHGSPRSRSRSNTPSKQNRSTNPFDGGEDSSINNSLQDASAAMDSLDQILDKTDLTVEDSVEDSTQTSLSEKALKAAAMLRMSFDQPSPRSGTPSSSQQSSRSNSNHVTPPSSDRYYKRPSTATIPEEGRDRGMSPPSGPAPLISPQSSSSASQRRAAPPPQPIRPIPQKAHSLQHQQYSHSQPPPPRQQSQPTLSFSLPMAAQRRHHEEPSSSQEKPLSVEQQQSHLIEEEEDDDDEDSFPNAESSVEIDADDDDDMDDDDENSESYDEVLSNILDGHSFGSDQEEKKDDMSNDGGVMPRGIVDSDYDKEENGDDEDRTNVEESSRLALHDLCDEARSKDDIAWHNALYLLSIRPELCSEHEQVCQMNPLHVCCLSTAPIWMTRALLYTRSEQCQETDIGGRLPLHLCVAMSADLDTMQLLVQEYPASVSHKDKRGFTPLHLLLKNDQINLTLEHLRILLGQTTEEQQQNDGEGNSSDSKKSKRIQFRKNEHLDANLEELEGMQRKQEAHHERRFTDYPGDVQNLLNKISLWKRRQVSKGTMAKTENKKDFVYDCIHPASVPTPTGKLLPLHLLVRRKLHDGGDDDITQSKRTLSSTSSLPPGSTLDLCRVLIHAYPEALITRDAGGRTPLLTAMLQTDTLPSEDVVETLLGLRTSQPLHITPAKFASDDTYQLPLHVAAEEMTSNYELLSTICEAYPEAIEKQDVRGRTPLHLALGNYRATPVDESLLELLTNKHVAKTRDFDGNRPLDWILEHPKCLVQRDDSLIFQQFLNDSIDEPTQDSYRRHSNDLIRQLQSLPPWLRRQACAAKHIQSALFEQQALPLNTFGVLLWGAILIALLVMVRLVLDEERSSHIVTVYVLASVLLARQVVRIMAATFLGEFYVVCLANPWTYVHWASGLLSIFFAQTVASEASAFESLLGPDSFDYSRQESLIDTLGACATASIWLSIFGLLVEWWCGMAIAFGSAVRVLSVLFWPFIAAGMGIVAASQILYTVEDCSDGICPLSDTYSTIYWTILGEPILTEDDSLSTAATIVLIVFTVLAIWWLISVVVLAVSEAQSLDRRQIALHWYWEPKVTMVWTRNMRKPELSEQSSCMQRYCDRMEELWFVLTALIKGDDYKRRELHWYSSCFRPGFVRGFMTPFALLVIPIWLILGAVTLGLLWPPQVRRWLFKTTILSKDQTTSIEDRLTGSKLSQLKGKWHKFEEASMERNGKLQDDISQIKEMLIRATLDDEKES